MADLSSKSVVVWDSGLFLHVALALARGFGKVFYYSPWEAVMPKLEKAAVGDGFQEIERVNDPEELIGKADYWCFTDVLKSGLQKYLVSIGEKVWGHHGADQIETNRGLLLKLVGEAGLPIPPHETIVGFSSLVDHLRYKQDKWIKVSRWRGNWETLHWRDYGQDIDEVWRRGLAIGPLREHMIFYVFDELESDFEDGIDTYCIKGKYPKTVMHGIERKDRSYLCGIQQMSEISDAIAGVNEAFAPILGRYDHGGCFSTEVRVANDTPYFIDATMRFASPVSQLMVEMFGNLADIVAAGSEGEVAEPETESQYGVQALISMDREPDETLRLEIPDSISQWCKFGFAYQCDRLICIPPHDLGKMLGWLVAVGDSPKAAIEKLKDYRKELPCGLDCDVESIASLISEAEDAKSEGVIISEKPLPDPSIVLEQKP